MSDDPLTRLRRAAREIYDEALADADAGVAVRRSVRLDGARLRVGEAEFDLRPGPPRVHSLALGKAGRAMASALDEVLGERLSAGVLSCPPPNLPENETRPEVAAKEFPLSNRWRVFAGGHPVPNEASLAAAGAAFELLRRADEAAHGGALVIFLVSGGGSAMMEWPRDESLTLADLRETNRVLVSCGASIGEVNAVRRALSAVKGGGLARRAARAPQVTLVVSDTNAGDAASVASGPTFPPPADAPEAAAVVARYGLETLLPPAVRRALTRPGVEGESFADEPLRLHRVLLDNARAVARAAEVARARGFVVARADDLVEQQVEEGSAALVTRLFELWRRNSDGGRAVCLVSGGEFACPVRGGGVGGRNAETALRCAFELEARAARLAHAPLAVALSAGTDGVDGNSPAAGALADNATLARARALNLDARRFLDTSDAYTFFRSLGDAVLTGPTGTNVRDLRVLLAE